MHARWGTQTAHLFSLSIFSLVRFGVNLQDWAFAVLTTALISVGEMSAVVAREWD